MHNLFKGRRKPRRVMVLGLDCASPQLIFDEFRDDLPALTRLTQSGTWGELASSIPCITIPAWSSMMSSHDPGVLGIYGFRNRADHSYDNMMIANGSAVKVKRVWDYLSEAGKQSVVIGVPQTYPPRPVNGHLVTDFLTPGTESAFTYPAIFKQEVLQVTPDYQFDVKGFRTNDKTGLLRRLYDMTEIQYKLVRHALKQKPWDFFMHVNIGVDRLHHGFWRFHDPQHRLHDPHSPLKNVIRDYYKMVDSTIGDLLNLIDDDTAVLVVSDHGVSRMDGGICINEWLWQNGWLAFKTPPPEGKLTKFEDVEVDWSRTRAWGSGGYYGRVFLNVAGREPEGIIPPEQYPAVREELTAALRAIPGPEGEPLATQVFQPEAIYQQVRNVAPDLMAYFGNLHWRSVGTLGHGRHYTLENDTGPDDANHAVNGMFILYDPRESGRGRVSGHQLMDIAPTLLHRLGQPVPGEMQGRLIE
ncbi:MAG: alkaline phosphatase family protein [Anaerolineaceae bacterium]|nr:alkaline phosphatase family protein [Anaerolineaceae bacterium]